MPNDAATNQITNCMIGEELFPRVGLQLLDAKRQPVVVAIDVQDNCIDALTLFQYLRGMLDPPGGNIGDVNQPVNSLFDFNESAKVGQIADTAADYGTDRVPLRQGAPGIRFGLLEP